MLPSYVYVMYIHCTLAKQMKKQPIAVPKSTLHIYVGTTYIHYTCIAIALLLFYKMSVDQIKINFITRERAYSLCFTSKPGPPSSDASFLLSYYCNFKNCNFSVVLLDVENQPCVGLLVNQSYFIALFYHF